MILLLALIALIVAVIVLSKRGHAPNALLHSSTETGAARSSAPEIVQRSPTSRSPEPAPVAVDGFWVPSGQRVSVAGREIPGGMLLVGTGLGSASRSMVEPALIDPALPVAAGGGATSGEGMTYWPSYSTIGAANRAAYLDWLATGRSAPGAYIGYVFLYFYGLERRVLDPWAPCPEPERRLIVDEVARLLRVYTGSNSFQNYAGAFLEVVLTPLRAGHAPDLLGDPVMTTGIAGVRAALGDCATRQRPIPAELAYQWLIANPTARVATPAQRCRADFHRLFLRRYEAQFGAGITIKGRAGHTQVAYQPANAGFGGPIRVTYPPDKVPRVPPDDIPARLQDLVDACTSDLDGYSRWIGRNPGQERSIAALALLPSDLLDIERKSAAQPVLELLESALATEAFAVLPGEPLLRDWPTGSDGKLGKADYVGLAQLLEKFGFGLEPDVRFGGPKFDRQDSVVVFRQPQGSSTTPSPEYASATLLLHLAALVSTADGSVSAAEEAHLVAHLENSMALCVTERSRLQAHLRWLVASNPGFGGVKKRIASLSESHRETLAQFLVSVAGADGAIANPEIETLQKIYRTIGLSPTLVFSHIHALSTDALATDQPITIIPSGRRELGFGVPAPPSASSDGAACVRLNIALVEKKLQQTSAVAALLGSVFAEAAEPAPSAVAAPAAQEAGIAGLDTTHSQLLRGLAGMSVCPRAEFDRLAASLQLLPDGALDRLNEAAYDATGGPLIDDGDPLTIDLAVHEELTR